MKLSAIDWVALVLVIIGGLNWGLVGAAGFDLVQAVFGGGIISTIVYLLVGLSAIWMIFISGKLEKKGSASSV